ncbi:MAG: dTDP-4-dehydrorhamnose reductase [Vampirovibrionales bacterium]|nr:dTDP-4-dehydrorhamnose reductase [Vampirovibrionales bacterium]
MPIKKIAITGAQGMLGRQLVDHFEAKGCQVLALTRQTLDLLGTTDEMLKVLEPFEPQVILHSAALTNVDTAQAQPELAMAINKDGTHKLAQTAQKLDCILAYVSTDYVFSGQAEAPYKTHDKPNPVNTYGLSKLYGELMVQELLDTYYIMRTSWLFGKYRSSFVDLAASSLKNKQPFKVIHDQVGSPSWTGSVSAMIEQVLESGAFGIYHTVCNQPASRRALVENVAQALQLPMADCPIEWISRQALNPQTPRPGYTALDPSPLAAPHWRTALEAYLLESHKA